MTLSLVLTPLALVLVGGLLAACGSAGSGATSPAAGTQLALTQCMYSHGVPDFPDPRPGTGGFSIVETSAGSLTIDGIAFSGPAFQAAARTCNFQGPGSGAPLTEAQKTAFIAKARCIRRHGVPGFPDPTFGPGGHGVGINLSSGLNGDSPAIRRAAKLCASVGAGIPGTAT
jgi:hypothetical protein